MGVPLRGPVSMQARRQSRVLDGLYRFASSVARRWGSYRILINLNNYKGCARGGGSALNYVDALDLPMAIQIDETTDKGKCAQVMAYVRSLKKDDEGFYFLKQNVLFYHQLPGRATSAEIMKLLQEALTKYGIPWSKVGSVCADRAQTTRLVASREVAEAGLEAQAEKDNCSEDIESGLTKLQE